MPYGKKRTYRRNYKRRNYMRKRRRLATKINRISKIVSADRHWYDDYKAAQIIDSTPSIWCLNASIVTGDANNNRQGNVIKPSFVDIKISLAINASLVRSITRVALVRDWGSPGGTTPNPNLIYDGTSFNTTQAVNAPRYVNQLVRFKVLYDKSFNCAVQTQNFIKQIRIARRLKGPMQYFNSVGTNVFDKGALYLLIWDDNNTAANYTAVSWVSRLTYYP